MVKDKEIYIGIHGFGLKKSQEFDYLKEQLLKEQVDFVTFDLYSSKAIDSDWNVWVKRAEVFVNGYLEQGYKVNLIGFSMGGVIASHLASFLEINSLILLAPAFEYLGISSIMNLANDLFSLDAEARKKYFVGKAPPTEYFLAFEALIRNLKGSIKKVSCPLFIIHGTNDEYVPAKSTKKAYKQSLSEIKRLIFIEGAPHELHLVGEAKEDVCRLVNMFISKKIAY